MLEFTDRSSPVRQACVNHLAEVRDYVQGLAVEAGVADPDGFARQWHVLMNGSIIAAAEGDPDAAVRARDLALLLLRCHGL
jgi:hypothetical protein